MSLTQVNSAGIVDGTIVNADINSSAAIALSKLASTPAVLTGSTNNTIATVTGANAIQGEANLTYNGSTLHVRNDSGGSDALLKLEAEGGADAYVELDTSNGGGADADIRFQMNGTTKGSISYKNENGHVSNKKIKITIE